MAAIPVVSGTTAANNYHLEIGVIVAFDGFKRLRRIGRVVRVSFRHNVGIVAIGLKRRM
jgi:hypothetical protein